MEESLTGEDTEKFSSYPIIKESARRDNVTRFSEIVDALNNAVKNHGLVKDATVVLAKDCLFVCMPEQDEEDDSVEGLPTIGDCVG